jgi:hypothetical protein
MVWLSHKKSRDSTVSQIDGIDLDLAEDSFRNLSFITIPIILSAISEKHYFVLCSICNDVIYGMGNVIECGYPICECGDKARPGKIIFKS